uniref:RNA-directed DNA polymerase, eukaryota, reverse transcriptase zinc-binding domain protein n=1 Tax=Tanacetum cinerariifolium TaxID=118510 RepID=A0A6L2NTC0_TANCI|nr:RNA-directed DNA polymerase, eukaryota, reverse transcriptase zinc-binding domain protein [Tanacetum cinerariifolium]
MIGHDKEEEEDALINILKTLVKECKLIYKKAQIRTPSSRTSEIQGVSFLAEEEVGDNSETLPYQQPSNEITQEVLLFLALLVDHFFATIHAQIDVFRCEILLGVRNEKVKFDMNEEICYSRIPLENIYMVSFIQKSAYFNPHEIENDDSPALEQRTFHYNEESVDTVDSSSYSQENEVGSHLSENVSRWHVCKPFYITFKVYEEDCGIWPTCNPDLSFCNGTKDDPYSRNFDVYKDKFDKEIEHLVNEYKLKAGRKRYALEEVWEKCENFHDSTKQWYDEGFEEEELWQNGIEDIDYTHPLAKTKSFEVYRYTFKNGKSFISITKQMNDVLPLGRVNRSRFIEKTRKEMDEEGGAIRKT